MRHYKRLLIVVLFLAVLLAVFEFSGIRGNVNLAYLHQKIVDNKVSGLLIFTLLYCLGNLIQIPGWIFLAAAVLALGRTWGGVATYIAAIVSCTVTFFTIRLIGGNALRELKNSFAVRLLHKLDTDPIKSVVLLRTLFQTMPALNYALALSGVRFYQYLTGTMLGLIVPTILYCWFFDYLAMAVHLH